MKTLLFLLGTIILCGQGVYAQQATEISVSLKTADGKYIETVAGGGLGAGATAVTAKQTFVLVDLNGGKIADGDKVKLKIDTSQWHEDKEKSLIHRVATKGAKEEESVFKLHVKDKLIYFETPSGKFIKIENNAVTTTGDAKSAALFDVEAAVSPTQAISYSVAFKFANGNHLGTVAGGGLDAASKEIGTNQIFNMIDLNGGNVSNGDTVKIVFAQSQMREDASANKIHRVSMRGAKEEECVFKIIVTGKNILLQTPSGKYLAVAPDGKSVVTTEKKDETSLLVAVTNPTPTVK